MGFRSVVLLRRTLGGMRTSVALVITAGTSQQSTPQIRIETDEASKVFLEYRNVFHIWLKFNSRGLWRAKRGLFFFLFCMGIWVASLKPWNSAVDASIGSDQNNSMEISWKVPKISDSSPFTLWKFSVSMLNFEFQTFSFYNVKS